MISTRSPSSASIVCSLDAGAAESVADTSKASGSDSGSVDGAGVGVARRAILDARIRRRDGDDEHHQTHEREHHQGHPSGHHPI